MSFPVFGLCLSTFSWIYWFGGNSRGWIWFIYLLISSGLFFQVAWCSIHLWEASLCWVQAAAEENLHCLFSLSPRCLGALMSHRETFVRGLRKQVNNSRAAWPPRLQICGPWCHVCIHNETLWFNTCQRADPQATPTAPPWGWASVHAGVRSLWLHPRCRQRATFNAFLRKTWLRAIYWAASHYRAWPSAAHKHLHPVTHGKCISSSMPRMVGDTKGYNGTQAHGGHC